MSALRGNASDHATLEKHDSTTDALLGRLGFHAERYGEPVADATDVYSSSHRYIIRSPLRSKADASVTGDRYIISGDEVRIGALALDSAYVYWQEPWGPRRAVRCAKKGCTDPEVLWVSTAGAKPTDWWGQPGAADGAVGLAVNDEAVFFTTGDGNVMKVAKPPVAKTDPKPQ